MSSIRDRAAQLKRDRPKPRHQTCTVWLFGTESGLLDEIEDALTDPVLTIGDVYSAIVDRFNSDDGVPRREALSRHRRRILGLVGNTCTCKVGA